MSLHIFVSNKARRLVKIPKKRGRQAAIHPFSSCVGGLQGHRQDCVTRASENKPPLPTPAQRHPRPRRGNTAQGGYYARGVITAGRPPKAKHLCI